MIFKRKIHFYSLSLIYVVVHFCLFRFLGLRDQLFDSKGYIDAASFLLDNKVLEDIRLIFYSVPISLIALFAWLCGNDGTLCFVIFQCLLSGVATVAIYKASSIVFDHPAAGFLSGCLFLFWWDVIHWNTTVMTESIQCSLICIIIYWISRFQYSLRDFAVLALLLMLSLMTRPTSVLIVCSVIVFLLQSYWPAITKQRVIRYFLLVILCVVSVVAAAAMFSLWDFTEQYVQGNIVTYMNTVENTFLYQPSLRLETTGLWLPADHDPPILKILTFIYHNPVHFLNAALLKVWYLLSGVRPYFSFIHNSHAICWHLLMYMCCFFGFKKTSHPGVKMFAATLVALNILLIGISTVDWDNRFYVPMQPAIAIMAGGGMACVYQRFSKNKQSTPSNT